MILTKKQIYQYLAVVFIFTSWIIFYTIPRDFQYPLFFIPAILFILYVFYPYKKTSILAFFLFSIVIFRHFIPETISLTDISFWAAMIRALLISSIFLIDKDSLVWVYHYFKKILFVILLISLPFFLIYIIGLYPFGPLSTYIGGDGEGRVWNVYLFFSLQVNPITGEIIRFPAIFDEPGFLGVILAFVLAIERFDLRKTKNRLFALCGILTFSMAFYVLTVLYFLLSTHLQVRQKLISLLVIAVFVFVGFVFFQEQMTDQVINRFYSEEGFFWDTSGRVGLERQAVALEGIRSLDQSEFLWGRGYGAHDGRAFAGSVTWERLIMQSGVVFTSLFILLILWYGSKKRNSFVFSVLFIASLLQRPAIFIPLWFFLLVYGVIVGESDELVNERK